MVRTVMGILILLVTLPALTSLEGPEKSLDDTWHMDQIHRQMWVDSVYNELSLDEKIGQLFMVAAYSNKGEAHFEKLRKQVKQNKIGGVIFFQGSPHKQARMTNRLQDMADVPLLISMDAEWGLDMRLDSTIAFPRQLTLGAIQNNKWIYKMGKEIARQCERLGVHVNLAPVVDVNSNPNNPVINDRSFGEDKFNVALKGLAYMNGLQDQGIMACAKHFPGHGDTDSDSHETLPVINHSEQRLRRMELYPFRTLINGGLKSVMAAHLHIPALDSTAGRASSLSPAITHDLLRKDLGFEGLVFSDALNMKGVSKFYVPGELELLAFEAGNDILLFPENVPKAKARLKKAVQSGRIQKQELEERVKKILMAKAEVGLMNYEPVDLNNITEDLSSGYAELLRQKLYEGALTLVNNKNDKLPVKKVHDRSFASLYIGDGKKTAFQRMLQNYSSFNHFTIDEGAASSEYDKLLDNMAGYDMVMVGLGSMSKYASRNYGISKKERQFLHDLDEKTDVALTVFGSPYSLQYFDEFQWLQCAYEENKTTQELAAQLLFGGINATGELPVTASERVEYGDGIQTYKQTRLKYSMPEEVGIPREDLSKMDSIAKASIANEATPGCQMLLAIDGKVILHKSYGHHTYDHKRPVQNSDIYDLASITKMNAATLSLMRLYEQGLIRLDRQIKDFLPLYEDATVKNLKIDNILTHVSGLKSWIPFYKETIDKGEFDQYYCNEKMGCFSVKVRDSLYMRYDYPDTIWYNIQKAAVSDDPEYKYSDLGFYIFKNVIERLTGDSLQNYVQKQFFRPLGLTTMGYRPVKRFPLERIVPTEVDQIFRGGLIHGYVHDPGAAMLGGISGHAGLFGNANDQAIILQMLMNQGKYGGKRYVKPETINLFTSKYNDKSRRGLGFNKPEPDTSKITPTAESASLQTFGHTGFTGTYCWADPKHDMVFVYLSNRVHPTAHNRKLIENDVRTRIHEVAYEAVQKRNAKMGARATN